MKMRRSRFAVAAEAWLKANSPTRSVTTEELWSGLCDANPLLTAASEGRKTPRTTCMRDLRNDGAFEVGGRKVRLK